MNKHIHFTSRITSILAFVVLTVFILMPGRGWGQTVPTAQTLPYISDFNTAFSSATTTTYPIGWGGHQLNTGLSTSFPTTAPTADRTLLASGSQSATGNDNMNFTKKVGTLAGGSRVVAPILAVNTSGYSNITVTFIIGTCRVAVTGANGATDVELQYRAASDNGPFTSSGGTVYTTYSTALRTASNDTSSIKRQIITVTLPVAANNLPTLQLRWASKSNNSTTSGSRASWTIDKVTVTGTSSCTTPSTQASNVSFTGVADNQMTVNWSRGGTPGDGVIVVAKAGSTPDDPADGTAYTANAAFGSGTQIGTGTYVIYIGSGTNVNVTALNASTTYYYKVYEKNCTGTSIMINTTSPAEGNQSTTAACSTNPTVITTTSVNTITPTTASSGGTGLSAGANCSISAKGVCWNTSTGPTTANSKTSDGTGATDFTSSITGLSAQTLYYVRAYATNGFGTAYGPEVTFRTLSTELTAHPANFTASSASSSQINLTFSAASTITNAKGYIILRRTGSNPGITNIIDGIAPSSLSMPSGTTFIADINSNSTTTFNNAGLPNANTQYNYSIIAYNWDGTNPETYNYYTGGTIKTTNATTLCSSTTIPYAQNFESAAYPAIPTCATIENAGTGNNWVTVSNFGYGFTTVALQYSYNSTNAANAWFFTQGLTLTGGTSYRLSFKYGCASASFPEKIKVSYGTSAASASMTTQLFNNSNVINDVTPITQDVDFTPSSTGVYYIGFNAYSNANMYALMVDDIDRKSVV